MPKLRDKGAKEHKGDRNKKDKKDKRKERQREEETDEEPTYAPLSTIIVCGNNQHGELATGALTRGIIEPQIVDLSQQREFRGCSVSRIFANEGCTYVVTTDSDVFACGRMITGKQSATDFPELTSVHPFVQGMQSNDPIIRITFEPTNTAEFFLTRNGSVYCRSYGEYIFPKPFKSNVPQLISPSVFGNSPIRLMDTDHGLKLFITDKDDIFTAKLASDKIHQISNEFLEGQRIKKVECGNNFGVILTETGVAYAGGKNKYNQLGKEHSGDFERVTSIDQKIVDVECGCFHIIYLTAQGNVYGIGFNLEGQLGIDHAKNQDVPTLITSLPANAVTRIHCTTFHSFFFTLGGDIYTCGLGHRGQLGLNTTKRPNPTCKKVTIVPSLVLKHFGETVRKTMLDVCAGVDHTIFYLTNELHERVDQFVVRLGRMADSDKFSDIIIIR